MINHSDLTYSAKLRKYYIHWHDNYLSKNKFRIHQLPRNPIFLAAANKYNQYSPIKSYPQSLHPFISPILDGHPVICWSTLNFWWSISISSIPQSDRKNRDIQWSFAMLVAEMVHPVISPSRPNSNTPPKSNLGYHHTPWLNGHETHHLWCFNHVQCPMFPSFLIVKSHCSSMFHPFFMVNSPIFPCNDACFAHLSWFNQFNPHFSRVKSHGKPPWESPAPPPAPSPARRLPGAVSRHRRLKASEIGILTVKNGKFTTKNMDLIWVYHELAFFFVFWFDHEKWGLNVDKIKISASEMGRWLDFMAVETQRKPRF